MSTLQQPDPFELAQRLASGCFDSDVLGWMQQGLAIWVREGGQIPLERCLHLPNTLRRTRLIQRNHWLCEAAKALDCSTSWSAALQLSKELDSFLSRGTWHAWQELDCPPEGASCLRKALFHVAKTRGGKSLTARQIDRCIGHGFKK